MSMFLAESVTDLNTTYFGCYKDEKTDRDLSLQLINVGSDNSVDLCINTCREKGMWF